MYFRVEICYLKRRRATQRCFQSLYTTKIKRKDTVKQEHIACIVHCFSENIFQNIPYIIVFQ